MNPAAEGEHIRSMAAADIPRVMELAATLPDAPHWPGSAYITALNPAATPRRIALVAASTLGAVSGFTVASLLPPQAELETIAVAMEYQRSGRGRRLFDALVTEFRTAGAQQIVLEVRHSNHAAIAFYRSLGFTESGRRPAYYADPVEDAVLMEFRL